MTVIFFLFNLLSVQVIWMYITDPRIGPFSRVKRARLTPAERSEILQRVTC